jgi:hypothetical protein
LPLYFSPGRFFINFGPGFKHRPVFAEISH